jgi:LDH2 family malate/lactate/ureidoglycolate dehydrogenase
LTEDTERTVDLNVLERFVCSILTEAGVAAEDAAIVANEVVDAEARGYEAQGLIRVAQYADAASSGATTSPTTLECLREAPSAVSWDAHDGWGHVAALRATEECVRRARETGACVGVIRNVGHIGRLGYYVDRAAELGAIGFVSCSGNASSATMAPWGGREPRLSTNPFAWGFPNPGGDNVVIDVSTTQAARGKVLVAAATGREIPSTWAFDAEGNPTRDPHNALPPNGTLAPLGGHKGYALAIAVELLSGGLGGPYPPPESSVFLAAYDPYHLTSEDEYREAVAELGELVGSSALRPGFDAARLPGVGAAERERHARAGGLRVTPEIWHAVVEAGASVGVLPPDDVP